MSNISDIIEDFILTQMQDFDSINLSRNELANYFNCAPSQINYVLSTRFTSPKGFLIESHRGGGGYIKLFKLNLTKNKYLEHIIKYEIDDELDLITGTNILENLLDKKWITDREMSMFESMISAKALANPFKMENRIRANIIKNLILNIIKEN